MDIQMGCSWSWDRDRDRAGGRVCGPALDGSAGAGATHDGWLAEESDGMEEEQECGIRACS